MASDANSQNQDANAGAAQFSVADIVGNYAFRFNGFTMLNNILYNLRGLGQFTIDEGGVLLGQHRSAITPLQGQAAKLQTGSYRLQGKVSLQADGSGDAYIHFRKTAGSGRDVDGEFFVQIAGSSDRLWFISSGETLPDIGIAADELVTLEAIRLT